MDDQAPPGPSVVQFALERPDADALRAMWIGLEQRADVTFYLSWAWIGAWVAEAGPPDFVLVGRAGGEIVCLGLLREGVQRRHLFVRSRTLYLHQTGHEEQDVIFIEYNGFLTDRRYRRLDAEAVAFLSGRGGAAPLFDELQMGGIDEDGHRALRKAGFRTHVFARKPTAFVDLAAVRASGGDYLATLSANSRYQIRRALKAYRERGELKLEPARTAEEAVAYFEALGVLHERAWRARARRWQLAVGVLREQGRKREPGGAWRYPFLVAFQRRLIEAEFAAGGVEIVRVSCGGTPIGYIHCLVRGGWIGSYLSGFAYERDNKVKPGLVSFYLYIEHKLKSSGEVLDFLAGDERYKTSLGRRGPTMFWLRVQQPRPQLLLERSLRLAKRRLEMALRRLLRPGRPRRGR